MQALVKSLEDFAVSKFPADQRNYYMRERTEDYADVFRITDVDHTNCWYGYFFTHNGSPYEFCENFTPNINGGEIVWPLNAKNGEACRISLQPGEDSIFIVRRTAAEANFGYSYLPLARKMNEDELLEMTKALEPKMFFDDAQETTCKMLNESYASVFYFENNSAGTLVIKFTLDLKNLAIEGEPEGTTEFSAEIPSGGTCLKILKPVVEGEGTSIGMSYSFKII